MLLECFVNGNGREVIFFTIVLDTYAWGGGANAAASLCLVAGCKGAANGAVVNGLGPL